MLNEILTGKASLDPTTPPPRATAPSQPTPGPTPPWPPAGYLPSAEYRAMERQMERSRRSHAILASMLAVAATVGILAFKWAARSAYREDMAEVHRTADFAAMYISDDPYVSEARRFASEMCTCQDKPCAWNVQRLANRWSRTTPKPNERVLEAALEHMDRYADCASTLIPNG